MGHGTLCTCLARVMPPPPPLRPCARPSARATPLVRATVGVVSAAFGTLVLLSQGGGGCVVTRGSKGGSKRNKSSQGPFRWFPSLIWAISAHIRPQVSLSSPRMCCKGPCPQTRSGGGIPCDRIELALALARGCVALCTRGRARAHEALGDHTAGLAVGVVPVLVAHARPVVEAVVETGAVPGAVGAQDAAVGRGVPGVTDTHLRGRGMASEVEQVPGVYPQHIAPYHTLCALGLLRPSSGALTAALLFVGRGGLLAKCWRERGRGGGGDGRHGRDMPDHRLRQGPRWVGWAGRLSSSACPSFPDAHFWGGSESLFLGIHTRHTTDAHVCEDKQVTWPSKMETHLAHSSKRSTLRGVVPRQTPSPIH